MAFHGENAQSLEIPMPRDLTAREIWKVSHESEVFLDMTEISEEIGWKKLSGL